jgi:hypothetical protein
MAGELHTHGRGATAGRRAGWPFALALSAALTISLAWLLWRQQEQVVQTALARPSVDSQGRPPPLAEVVQATRALKLVTVVVDATVETQRTHSNWRGTVTASAECPVRYLFGVDLSNLAEQAVRLAALGTYTICAPQPELIAAEAQTDATRDQVTVSGLRFRSLAGEAQLGLARRDISSAARRQEFPPELIESVRAQTREQIASAVQALLGGRAHVLVRFAP